MQYIYLQAIHNKIMMYNVSYVTMMLLHHILYISLSRYRVHNNISSQLVVVVYICIVHTYHFCANHRYAIRYIDIYSRQLAQTRYVAHIRRYDTCMCTRAHVRTRYINACCVYVRSQHAQQHSIMHAQWHSSIVHSVSYVRIQRDSAIAHAPCMLLLAIYACAYS